MPRIIYNLFIGKFTFVGGITIYSSKDECCKQLLILLMETASLGRDQSAITIINCLSEYIVSVKILKARPVVIEGEFFHLHSYIYEKFYLSAA